MKKITDYLRIKSIEISMLKQVATVIFEYLDEYKATALYAYRSSGNTWLETGDEVGPHTHNQITEEVEDNEEQIIDWVNTQFDKA